MVSDNEYRMFFGTYQPVRSLGLTKSTVHLTITLHEDAL